MCEFIKTAVVSDGKFSADLHNIVKRTSENHVMSSSSLGFVMGMVLAGGKGNTANQIREALHQSDNKDLFDGFKAMVKTIKELEKTDDFILRTVNCIYIDQAFAPLPEFLDRIRTYFMAEIQAVDFVKATEKARNHINSWVEAQTNRKIIHLLPPDSISDSTVSLLINALYFKGYWAKKFDPEETFEADFFVDKSNVANVLMMRQTGSFDLTTINRLNGAVALRMPYKGEKLDMIFILPNEKDNIEGLEAKLKDIDFSDHLVDFSTTDEVEVLIPRFKVETTLELGGTLAKLGVVDVFDPAKADLSGVAGTRNLCVSKVMQKAFIEVNEEGSEAAASSAVAVCSYALHDMTSFCCNRPFYFMIRDRGSNLVLFSGRVSNPTK